jgi:hypothetical protein
LYEAPSWTLLEERYFEIESMTVLSTCEPPAYGRCEFCSPRFEVFYAYVVKVYLIMCKRREL